LHNLQSCYLACFVVPVFLSVVSIIFSVIPVQAEIQSLVIPVKTGIQIQLDPQSEALRFRLRMTGGNGSRVSSLVIPVKTGIQSLYSGSRIKRGMPRIENKHFLTGIDKRIIA